MAHGLIPDELNTIAIALYASEYLRAARHWRTVGANLMFNLQAGQMVQSGQQHAWVTILFTANGENIKQYWPKNIVHGQIKFRKVDRHRIGCIRWRWLKDHLKARNDGLMRPAKGMGRGNMPASIRRVFRITIKQA